MSTIPSVSLQGGYAYIRFHNPTCEAVQKAVNSIEGGFGSVVFGSGMAAISTTLLTFLQPGDHVVRISLFLVSSRNVNWRLWSKLVPIQCV